MEARGEAREGAARAARLRQFVGPGSPVSRLAPHVLGGVVLRHDAAEFLWLLENEGWPATGAARTSKFLRFGFRRPGRSAQGENCRVVQCIAPHLFRWQGVDKAVEVRRARARCGE